MTANIAGNPGGREVGRSNRLHSTSMKAKRMGSLCSNGGEVAFAFLIELAESVLGRLSAKIALLPL
jgi:hypothetical protein